MLAGIALFVVIGGTAFAVSRIDGRTIEVDSIPGNRLEAGGVTGKQVKERSLSAVPRAKTTKQVQVAGALLREGEDPPAGNAAVIKLDAGESQPVAASGPITIDASCSDTGSIEVTATSTEDDTWLSSDSGGYPLAPGSPAYLYGRDGSDQPGLGGNGSATFPALTVAAPSGAALNVGPAALGNDILDADCVAVMYTIG